MIQLSFPKRVPQPPVLNPQVIPSSPLVILTPKRDLDKEKAELNACPPPIAQLQHPIAWLEPAKHHRLVWHFLYHIVVHNGHMQEYLVWLGSKTVDCLTSRPFCCTAAVTCSERIWLGGSSVLTEQKPPMGWSTNLMKGDNGSHATGPFQEPLNQGTHVCDALWTPCKRGLSSPS